MSSKGFYQSDSFKELDKATQKVARKGNSTDFTEDIVKHVCSYLDDDLDINEETAYSIIAAIFIDGVKEFPIDSFAKLFLESKSVKEVRNKLWNIVRPKMPFHDFMNILIKKIAEIIPTTKIGQSKNPVLKKALGSTKLFDLYITAAFRYIERETYYIFFPSMWFFRDNDTYIPFKVSADNFSFTTSKQYLKLDEKTTFKIGNACFYFARIGKSTKNYPKILPLAPPALEYFSSIAPKINDSATYEAIIGLPMYERRDNSQDLRDIIDEDTYEDLINAI